MEKVIMDLQLFAGEDEFHLQSDHMFEIDTTPDGEEETLEELAVGISDFDPAPNDEIDQTQYLSGKGFGSSDVTGQQLVISFEGHRFKGDPAQDYIFGLQNKVGKARKTKFVWTKPDGSSIEGDVTIANITGPSGPANEKGAISFEIHFNGAVEEVEA